MAVYSGISSLLCYIMVSHRLASSIDASAIDRSSVHFEMPNLISTYFCFSTDKLNICIQAAYMC